MAVIKGNQFIDVEAYGRSSNDSLSISDQNLNAMINSMCGDEIISSEQQMSQQQFTNFYYDEQQMERLDAISVEQSIIDDIHNSIDRVPIDGDESDILMSSGIYQDYLEKKNNISKQDTMISNDIEEELKNSMKQHLKGDIISDEEYETLYSNATFSKDDAKESMDSDKVKIIDTSKEDSIISNEKEVIEEDINDVKAIEIDNDLRISDEEFEKGIINQYGISDSDALQIIQVFNRYQSGEKFKVMDALPKSFQNAIITEAKDAGISSNHYEYAAKHALNSMFEDISMTNAISNFNNELSTVTGSLNNITGLAIDEYNNELEKMFHETMINNANKILENSKTKADEIRASNPKEADKILIDGQNTYDKIIRTTKTFKESYELTRIKDSLKQSPSNANKAYKDGRDHWTRVNRDIDAISETLDPKLKSLELCRKGMVDSLGYPDDFTKAFLILVANSVQQSMKNPCVEEHTYSYYILNNIYSLGLTQNIKIESDILITLKANIDEVIDIIKSYMETLWSKKKKNK